jgi:hypothetical protein
LGTVDEVGRRPTGGDASGVGALVVVVADVGVQVSAQAGVAGNVKATERRSPALLEKRAVQTFDVPVGLWASGADARLG